MRRPWIQSGDRNSGIDYATSTDMQIASKRHAAFVGMLHGWLVALSCSCSDNPDIVPATSSYPTQTNCVDFDRLSDAQLIFDEKQLVESQKWTNASIPDDWPRLPQNLCPNGCDLNVYMGLYNPEQSTWRTPAFLYVLRSGSADVFRAIYVFGPSQKPSVLNSYYEWSTRFLRHAIPATQTLFPYIERSVVLHLKNNLFQHFQNDPRVVQTLGPSNTVIFAPREVIRSIHVHPKLVDRATLTIHNDFESVRQLLERVDGVSAELLRADSSGELVYKAAW